MSYCEIEYLGDSGTTQTILWNMQLFKDIVSYVSSLTTIVGSSQIIQERGPAHFLLLNGMYTNVINDLYAKELTEHC